MKVLKEILERLYQAYDSGRHQDMEVCLYAILLAGYTGNRRHHLGMEVGSLSSMLLEVREMQACCVAAVRRIEPNWGLGFY